MIPRITEGYSGHFSFKTNKLCPFKVKRENGGSIARKFQPEWKIIGMTTIIDILGKQNNRKYIFWCPIYGHPGWLKLYEFLRCKERGIVVSMGSNIFTLVPHPKHPNKLLGFHLPGTIQLKPGVPITTQQRIQQLANSGNPEDPSILESRKKILEQKVDKFYNGQDYQD